MTDAPADVRFGIAVVGLAARLPGAASIEALRAMVRAATPGLSRFDPAELQAAGIGPDRLNDPQFVPAKGFIEDADRFDHAFFRMSPALARAMDPQHRLFLECCWHALEDAGLGRAPAARRVGVFAGASASSSYLHSLAAHDPETAGALDPFQLYIVNQPAALPNQASFHFDLTGPSVAVQTACSTGLAAVVAACQSLLDVQCDAAVAGAVTITLPLVDGYLAPPGSILSPDGTCTPFAATANGTVPGDGVAAVVLKRLGDALADRDRIYAVIRGYGVSNDGGRKVGFSAPNAAGQAAAITDALAMAELEPEDIGYIETHGTATALGDAIEIAALREVFASCPTASLPLGGIKAQIGHLDVAAGLAGFIKAVIAVDEKIIPPLHGATRANPDLALAASPFRLPSAVEPWPDDARPRRAGVSSFGMGGTNIHVVIEAPLPGDTVAAMPEPAWAAMPLSAPTADGLEWLERNLATFLRTRPHASVADVGTTCIRRRLDFEHRRAVVAATSGDAAQLLEEPVTPAARSAHGVVFAFVGQGGRQVGIASGLAAVSPSFAAALDACRSDLATLGCDVDPYLFGSPDDHALSDRMGDTEVAQPTLFAFGYALAAMLREWGLTPAAMIGHSLGEYLALCAAGALSCRDALALVVARARAMQALDDGAMLAIAAPFATVEAHLEGRCEIAACNGPTQLVVAGPVEAVARTAERLAGAGVRTHPLGSRRAFHSWMMDPALGAIEAAAARAELSAPSIPVIANVSGKPFGVGQRLDPAYFAAHARTPVRFGDGVATLVGAGHRLFLEIGAGAALTGLIRAHDRDGRITAVPVLPHPVEEDAVPQVLRAVAQIWEAGGEVDWEKVDISPPGRPLSLPHYPFARTRCWVGVRSSPADGAMERPTRPLSPARGVDEVVACVVEIWAGSLGQDAVGADDNFHRLGGDSLAAVHIAARLADRFDVAIRPADFLAAPTPRRLAALIAERRRGKTVREGCVIDPRPDVRGDPLVLFHAVGGTVHLYGELVASLREDRAIRLVQAAPFADGSPQAGKIEAMADAYLGALDLDRARPVHFAGASFGGFLAFEAARRWRAQGGQPASVILLDSPAPGDIAAALADDADILAFITRLVGRPVPAAELRLASASLRQQRIIDVLKEHLPDGIDDAARQLHVDVLKANAQAMNHYRPAASRAAPVTLITARTRSEGQPAHPERGWAQVACGGLVVETVPGDHLSMLVAPQAAATARAIEQAIDRAARAASTACPAA